MLALHSFLSKTNYTFLVGDLVAGWAKDYGNIYQQRLLTDNRVWNFTILSPVQHENELCPQITTIEPVHIKVLHQVIVMSDFGTLIFPSKAILVTQFDAFDKGKWLSNNRVGKSPMDENLRACILLPIQAIAWRRSFQC